MYYVYYISSRGYDFNYVGIADDLKRRIAEHNLGRNRSTKFYAPFDLVYYEAYIDKRDAVSREKKLKHHGSVIGHLKKRLRYSLEKGGA